MTKEELEKIEKMIRSTDYHRLMEVRAHLEERAEGEETKRDMIIEGTPIVYEAMTELFRFKNYDGKTVIYNEIIAKGAVDENTRMGNCFMKFNHSEDVFPVARVKNGSLELISGDDGIHMKAKVVDTPTGKELFKLVEEGILDRMSFAFAIDRDKDSTIVSEEDDEKVVITRTINHIPELFDVAAVMVPAYEQTSLYARCKEDVETYLKQVEADKREALEKARVEEIRKEVHEMINSADISHE